MVAFNIAYDCPWPMSSRTFRIMYLLWSRMIQSTCMIIMVCCGSWSAIFIAPDSYCTRLVILPSEIAYMTSLEIRSDFPWHHIVCHMAWCRQWPQSGFILFHIYVSMTSVSSSIISPQISQDSSVYYIITMSLEDILTDLDKYVSAVANWWN